MVSSGFEWFRLVSNGFILRSEWFLMVSCGFEWFHLVPTVFIWFRILVVVKSEVLSFETNEQLTKFKIEVLLSGLSVLS